MDNVIDLGRLWLIVRRNWTFMLALGVIVGGVAFGVSKFVIHPQYSSSTAHSTFDLLNTRGLTTILASNAQPKDTVQKTFVENLEVLTSGPVPPNPAELLSSARMASLVEWMRNNYDVVVLDVPPVMAVTDAHVLMPLIDGAILVTTFGKTLKINLQRTVETLRLTDTKILGIVQRVRGGKNDAGYGYGYGYGYGQRNGD